MNFERIPEIAEYLSLVFFLYWISGMLVWNFMPVYFERHIANVFWVGVLTSLTAFVPVLIDIPVGNLVQRTGEKTVIFLGFIFGVFPPLLYLTAAPILFGVAKISEGFGKSMTWSGGWSVAMKSAKEDYESEALSVFLLGVQLAAVIGPVIGGYLIASYGFSLPLGIWFVGSILTLSVFYLYIGLEGHENFIESMEDLFERKTYSNDFHHLKENWEKLRLPLSLIFFRSVIFAFFWLAIPLMLDRMGASFIEMGLVFGVAAAPRTFQFIFGNLGDKVGHLKVTAVLAAAITPLLFIMGLTHGLYTVAGLYLITMLLVSGTSPVIHAIFDSRVPEEVESELVGFLELVKHSGQGVGPLMAGAVASVWSLNASFIAASLFALCLFLIASYGVFRDI